MQLDFFFFFSRFSILKKFIYFNAPSFASNSRISSLICKKEGVRRGEEREVEGGKREGRNKRKPFLLL